MVAWRRPRGGKKPDDRAWSAHANVDAGGSGGALAGHRPLPAETGPTWAPDRLSVWPLEGGRYGIDAHYYGPTGVQRAEGQRERLKGVGLAATVRADETGGLMRLGPLAHGAVWIALEAFLGRPLPQVTAEAMESKTD